MNLFLSMFIDNMKRVTFSHRVTFISTSIQVQHLKLWFLPTVHLAKCVHTESSSEVIPQVAEVAAHAIRHDLRILWPSSSVWILAASDWQPGSRVEVMYQGRLTACFSGSPCTWCDSTPSSGPHLELGPEGSSTQCSSVGCSPFSGVKRINWCRKCCSML